CGTIPDSFCIEVSACAQLERSGRACSEKPSAPSLLYALGKGGCRFLGPHCITRKFWRKHDRLPKKFSATYNLFLSAAMLVLTHAMGAIRPHCCCISFALGCPKL